MTVRPRLVLCLAAALTGGCSWSYDQKFFDYDLQQSRTRAMLDAQAAKGAAEDPTLLPVHFEGQRLNGLGRDKIDRVLAHRSPGGEVTVYIDLPLDADLAVTSVCEYLATSGVAQSEMRVVRSPSAEGTPATAGIAGLQRLRSGGDDAAGEPSQIMANKQ